MAEGKKKFYVTTPIFYPSDKLHIGHTYTTVAADVTARFKRQQGYDVMFLTGTDEHGQKIQLKATEKGVTPKQFVDDVVAGIKRLWDLMDISYDQFIRTTDDYHVEIVQKIFKQLYDQGDIYKDQYEGWYCTPCESFWTEHQLVDGKCPDCGREVQLTKEESYFFRLSKYADRLIEYIETHPEFIQPQTRQNEMLNNFLRPGLEDLCVSRTSFDWGIPVTFDPGHVVYVWVDALSNYISALGYLSKDDSKFKKYWPANVHIVGKEIVRFHTIIWPIMLMALGLPLPEKVFGHGWLILEGGKMSKSKGNVVDPVTLVEKYGVDSIRYFLMREIPFGSDGIYSEEALVNRLNADLANDLGNLLSRSTKMVESYFGGVLPAPKKIGNPYDEDLIAQAEALPGIVADFMDKMQFSNALAEIFKVVSRANKYIDETTPWVLAKDDAQKERLGTVLYNLIEVLRYAAVLLAAFMPYTPDKIFAQIGVEEDVCKSLESLKKFGGLNPGTKVAKGEIIFPRRELPKVESKPEVKPVQKENQPKGKAKAEPVEGVVIGIEDFAKVQLKTAKILEAEMVEGSRKLIRIQVDDGAGKRQIVSGIRKWYTPEELVGKTVIVITNLKPAKLAGLESNGMLLAAEADGQVVVLTVDRPLPPGSPIS